MSTSSQREVKIFRSFSIVSPRGTRTHGTYHQQQLRAALRNDPRTGGTRRAAPERVRRLIVNAESLFRVTGM